MAKLSFTLFTGRRIKHYISCCLLSLQYIERLFAGTDETRTDLSVISVLSLSGNVNLYIHYIFVSSYDYF